MNWQYLTSLSQLKQLTDKSFKNPVLIFKHSTRCSISKMILTRFEREWDNKIILPFFVDLINYRNISNEIAIIFKIKHESPQVLVINNGKCVNHSSHNAISAKKIKII